MTIMFRVKTQPTDYFVILISTGNNRMALDIYRHYEERSDEVIQSKRIYPINKNE